VLSEEELRWDEAMLVWRRARLFEQRAKRVTSAFKISFARWEALEVADRLIRERHDLVSQLDVATRAGLAKATVSDSMRRMMRDGLVDIGPDRWGMSDRILVTEKGERLIVALRGKLVDVARLLVEPVTRAQR
jgi:Mn-dependent DtxR family transcriptional regulator